MKKIIVLICFVANYFSSNAQIISASQGHSLRLTCTETIPEAFGYDFYGQLGNGTTSANQNTPILVHSPSGITSVSAGGYFSLFLKNDGTVWACGGNANGQLGNGTTLPSVSPVQVSGLTNIISIAGGLYFSLFLKNDGTVWACGDNSGGQLGDGTQTPRTTPVQVIGLTGITAISAGFFHSLFLKNDGTVWACGGNGNGQLGDGTTTNKLTPVQVSGLTGISKISAGSSHSIFLKNDGTAWSTGNNLFGQLGDGTTTSRSTAVQVSGITTLIGIEAGNNHTLFLKSNGTAWSCGDNTSGQLGDGTTTNRLIPVQVNNISNISELSGGEDHSLFLQNNNVFWACGSNQYGKLGDGTFVDRLSPVQILDTGIPEINIKGNNVTIVDGDATPSASDHTNIGSVLVGNSASRTYTIENTGTGTLSTPVISSSNNMFTIGSVTPSSFILPGNSATVVVTFTPTSTGQKNGILTFENNDCDEMPYTFSIRGTGVATCPTITFNETHNQACIGSTDGVITISGSSGGTGPYTFSKDSGLTFQSSGTFSNLAPGIYPMRIKDLNGCVSAAVAVNVNDQTPPSIICPPNFTAYQGIADNCLITYADTLIMITDNCLMPLGGFDSTAAIQAPRYRINGGGFKFMNFTGGTQGGSGGITFTEPLPLGLNYITYYATDSAGNTDSCTQIITVLDTVAPLFQPIFNNYAFETDTAVGLEDLSSGSTEIIPAGSDNVSSAVQTIPFFFDFHSVVYTNFSVSSNGLLGFGTNPVTTSAVNSTTVNQNNKVYVCWDNLHTGTNGSVKYKVIGTMPNRKLVIEWKVRNAAESGNFTKTFQAWLWEGSHKVQLVFGSGTNFPSATIGVRGANASIYNDVTTSNHTSSKTTINDANTLWPGSGRTYIFSPAIFATAPSGSCSTTVTWSIPNFIDCNDLLWNQSHQSGDNFPIGTTQLIYTVSDATPPPNPVVMNTTTYAIPVIVEDTQAPVISCIGSSAEYNEFNFCEGYIQIPIPTITDNCTPYVVNNALNFDGGGYVEVPPTSVINTASQTKRTVELSFRVNNKNLSGQKQVLWEEGGLNNGLNLYVYNGSLYFGIYSETNGWNGQWLSTANIINGKWHHATLVYDGSLTTQRLKAYLDGELVASANASTTLGSSLAIHTNTQNSVGALASNGKFHDGDVTLPEGHYFNGDIDELRIWNVARTSLELAASRKEPLVGNETGLILYYPFNQGNACSNNFGIDFLDDQTATNLNGVIHGLQLYYAYASYVANSCTSNWVTGSPAFNGAISLTNNLTGKAYASGVYPVGNHVLIWTATDRSGNSVSCTDYFSIIDVDAPKAFAPPDTVLQMNLNTCVATYSISADVFDNCPNPMWGYATTGATVTSSNGFTLSPGNTSLPITFNKGITEIVLDAWDGNNVSNLPPLYSTYSVTVNDDQAPTLVAPANQTRNVIANTCAANYTIADPFTDNCTGGNWGYFTSGATTLSSSGNTRNDGQSSGVLSFNKGITTVTLTGTDGTNAATSVTFTVTVNDNQAPTLVAPANQTRNVIANTCAANYTIPDPFSDNCTGGSWGYSTTGATVLSSSGNTRNDGQSSGVLSFNKGVTTVTLTGTDGSNAATAVTFTVTVNDNQNPTLSCPANQVLNTTTCSALYTIVDPVSDNCPGATWGYSLTGATQAAVSGISDGANSNPIVFFPGTTVVSLHAQDASLNGAIGCTFTVTVNSSTCTQTINLTLFLQGFYTGNSTMAPALFNQGVSAPLTTTDSITVSLIALDGNTVVASTQTTLQTDGTAVSTFFPAQFGYYYLSVKHRNSIETYTSNAMYVDANTTYDFTNTALKAFGSNQIEVENGVWAFYSGDINQDYSIDAFDYVQLDPDVINGVFGYTVTDLTGDGYVDAFDYIILDANLINGVGVIAP